MAIIAGIGFTISIFITGLAFPREDLAHQAKLGVLAGSTIAAALGEFVLSTNRPRFPPTDRHVEPPAPGVLDAPSRG